MKSKLVVLYVRQSVEHGRSLKSAYADLMKIVIRKKPFIRWRRSYGCTVILGLK
jgi:hypothetical protein